MGQELTRCVVEAHHLSADRAMRVLIGAFVRGVTWQRQHIDCVELYLLGGAHRARLLLEDSINETLTIDRMAMRLKHPDHH